MLFFLNCIYIYKKRIAAIAVVVLYSHLNRERESKVVELDKHTVIKTNKQTSTTRDAQKVFFLGGELGCGSR